MTTTSQEFVTKVALMCTINEFTTYEMLTVSRFHILTIIHNFFYSTIHIEEIKMCSRINVLRKELELKDNDDDVNIKDEKLHEMKNHYRHVFMQQLLPIYLTHYQNLFWKHTC
ncbi:hypothetical protein CR513_41311, partial [Mucuna pruriens]